MITIIVLKKNFRVDLEQDPSHKKGRSMQVDLSQCKSKSGCYHSLKTQLKGQPRARLRLRVSWFNPG